MSVRRGRRDCSCTARRRLYAMASSAPSRMCLRSASGNPPPEAVKKLLLGKIDMSQTSSFLKDRAGRKRSKMRGSLGDRDAVSPSKDNLKLQKKHRGEIAAKKKELAAARSESVESDSDLDD